MITATFRCDHAQRCMLARAGAYRNLNCRRLAHTAQLQGVCMSESDYVGFCAGFRFAAYNCIRAGPSAPSGRCLELKHQQCH